MQAIIDKYGFKEGLKTVNGVITNWVYDAPQPTQEELEIILAEFEAKNMYKKLRKQAYPPTEDQLDLIYHNGIEGWREMILEIKNLYPKPE